MPVSGLGLSLSPGRKLPIRSVVRLVQMAENLGYDSVWIPETWGTDSVSVLAALATSTTRIRLASGVFNIFSRSPTLLAQTAASLQELSHNRFILGLGVSGPTVVQNWHGVPFSRPLQRTRETVEIVRLALSGKAGQYAGREFTLSGFSLVNPPTTHIPIYIAALGPRNIRLTGEIADGWLPIFPVRDHLKEQFGILRSGAESTNRGTAELQVAAFIPCMLGARGDSLLRQQLAYYLGGMGTFYATYFDRLGFASEAGKVREAWTRGERKRAVQAVTEGLLAACTLGSSVPEVLERLTEFRLHGVTQPVLAFPHGASEDEIEDTLTNLAPDYLASGPL